MYWLPSGYFVVDWHPVAVTLGPLSIRWYGICFSLATLLFTSLFFRDPVIQKDEKKFEFILTCGLFCTLLGAKLGYVLFYTPIHLWLQSLTALNGLSFHGGILGVFLTGFITDRRYGSSFLWTFFDRTALLIPWSLLLGRIGNFLNSELIGRPTLSASYGFIFPYGDLLLIPRHPSQLYEAFGEGLLLGLLLSLFAHRKSFDHKPGQLSAVFLIGYGIVRLLIEYFREPDQQIGLLFGGLSMGQWLCLVMIHIGLFIFFYKHAQKGLLCKSTTHF